MHLVQRRAQTTSRGRHKSSQMASVTVSKHDSSGESKSYGANSTVMFSRPLKVLARPLLALERTAALGKRLAGGRHIADSPNGIQFAVPPSRRVGPAGPTPRHAEPRMAAESSQWEDNVHGSDFVKDYNRLAEPEELRKLREIVLKLESQLSDAIDEEDYIAAARLRDEIREWRSFDPEVFMASLSMQIQSASKADRYKEAAKYRDQLRIVREEFLPEYRLAGTWKLIDNACAEPVDSVAVGVTTVDTLVRMIYIGDTLIVTGMDGEPVFIVDVSQPSIFTADRPHTFQGEGRVAGEGKVTGWMCVMSDEFIVFWLSGKGGKERVLAVAAGRGRGGCDGLFRFEKVADKSPGGEHYGMDRLASG